MDMVYVIKGELIDQETIKLKEKIPFAKGELKLVITRDEPVNNKRFFGMDKGKIEIMPEFHKPLDEFSDYL